MLRTVPVMALAALWCGSAQANEYCPTASDHVEYRACLENLAVITAAEVAAAEDAARGRIERWDEEAPYRERSLALFGAMAAQFQKYRSARCELVASGAAGGNGAGDIRLICEIRLNRAYAEEIKNIW